MMQLFNAVVMRSKSISVICVHDTNIIQIFSGAQTFEQPDGRKKHTNAVVCLLRLRFRNEWYFSVRSESIIMVMVHDDPLLMANKPILFRWKVCVPIRNHLANSRKVDEFRQFPCIRRTRTHGTHLCTLKINFLFRFGQTDVITNLSNFQTSARFVDAPLFKRYNISIANHPLPSERWERSGVGEHKKQPLRIPHTSYRLILV